LIRGANTLLSFYWLFDSKLTPNLPLPRTLSSSPHDFHDFHQISPPCLGSPISWSFWSEFRIDMLIRLLSVPISLTMVASYSSKVGSRVLMWWWFDDNDNIMKGSGLEIFFYRFSLHHNSLSLLSLSLSRIATTSSKHI
jgi:hypothetical protein